MLEALRSALVISSLIEGGVKIVTPLVASLASLYPIGWLLLGSHAQSPSN
jgi:hypothetical protein